MAPGQPASLAQRMLSDHLREDDPLREKSVARFLCALAAFCAVVSAALIPIIGRGLGLSLVGAMLLLVAWYLVVWQALARGLWHPAIAWINVGIEVSVPTLVFALDTRFHGPEYALSAPPLVLWGGLIFLAALRSRRSLALAAGLLAAVEYIALYFFVIEPRLPAETLVTFSPAFVLIRAAFLAANGVLTAIVAGHLLRKADQALKAVRERDLFGKYFLHERIGAGGMAEVFRATYSPEGGFEKTVAVKRILPAYSSSREFVDLFKREAHFGSLLTHPNIVQVLDVGRQADMLFLAMEYVDGVSLRSLLNRRAGRPLPLAAVAFIGAEIAGALDYMHGRTGPDGQPLKLVHRDLNPPNILLSRIGEVKLADFGIARAQVSGAQETTRAGIVRGKVGYMAPEQALANVIDGRADLFALGLTLHEALTGERVFDGDDELALMMASVNQPIPPPSHLRGDVPAELDALVMALLERDLDRRLSSASALRSKLCLLPGTLAPYPHGQLALASAVQEALVVVPESTELRTMPDVQPSSADAPTSTARVLPVSRA